MNDVVPDSLVSYRDALEEAIRRDLDAARSPRPRTLVLRGVLALAVLAAVAFAALSIVSRPASGASVVRRAAAAVAVSPGTILHVDMLGSQTNPDGSVVRWRDESWQQESAPYARRQVETGPDGTVTESASTSGSDEVYDPKTDTIYVSPESSTPAAGGRPWTITRGSNQGTFVLQLRGPAPRKPGAGTVGGRSVVVTARQVRALRNGKAVVGLRIAKGGVVGITLMPAPKGFVKARRATPSPPDPDPSSGAFRDQILALLNSGGAHVAGHATVDGRDTIEIDSADGHTTYYVDPASYAPVELTTRGTGGGTALRFRTYENLAFDANRSLLSLEAQHPNARIDRDPSDYRAADARVFPRG